MKKYLPLILAGMSLFGCQNQNENRMQQFQEQPAQVFQISPSYKLEDLCDTEVDWKSITIHVYIEPSQGLWEFYKYKDKIFPYISDFFREQMINCKIVDANEPLKPFNSSNEFGIEIWDSQEEKEKRYWELSTGLEVPKSTGLSLAFTSQAVTRAGISLTHGKRKASKEMSSEEINKIILGLYETNEEYPLKNWAAHFSHEILHCMGLFHPETFYPMITEDTKVPNVMLPYDALIIPRFTNENSLGYCLDSLQQKLIHSYIAEKNNYKVLLILRKT
jgi:hypothetical protein